MTDEIQILTEQEANKKDITLKFPGATADLIATKNLFDVFLKTKVFETFLKYFFIVKSANNFR